MKTDEHVVYVFEQSQAAFRMLSAKLALSIYICTGCG